MVDCRLIIATLARGASEPVLGVLRRGCQLPFAGFGWPDHLISAFSGVFRGWGGGGRNCGGGRVAKLGRRRDPGLLVLDAFSAGSRHEYFKVVFFEKCCHFGIA